MSKDDCVICPACAHEFGAIPVSVQEAALQASKQWQEATDHLARRIKELEARIAGAILRERERCLAEVEQGVWFDKTTEEVLDSIAAAIRSGE